MENLQLYTLNEIMALIIAIVIGGGAYIVFVWKKKLEKVTWQMVASVFGLCVFFTYIAAEITTKLNLGSYRTIILPLVAFSAQWIGDYVFVKYPKFFDGAIKKTTGIDMTDKPSDEPLENNNDETNI